MKVICFYYTLGKEIILDLLDIFHLLAILEISSSEPLRFNFMKLALCENKFETLQEKFKQNFVT